MENANIESTNDYTDVFETNRKNFTVRYYFSIYLALKRKN